jgi:hypothetical protein
VKAVERAGDRTGPEAGKKGLREKRGGKAEMLKTERKNAPLDAEIWRYREDSQLFSFVASVALQTALPRFYFARIGVENYE